MAEWKKTHIGQFLKERDGHYSPDDEKLTGLERLNKIDFSGEIHLSGKGSKTNMIIVEPGDLVISGINVAKGAITVYQGNKPITATIHYSSYKFDPNQIDIEYFKRFVKSQSFIQALEVRGGIKTEIKPKHFLPIEIDLPDINEQRTIVSFFRRIEDEMSGLGSEISEQGRYLGMLRQVILQDAIEGKLTVEWRKKNLNLISGENHSAKLLENIRAEKERHIRERKIRKARPLPLITEDEKLFALPKEWTWCRLGEIALTLSTGPFGSMLHKADYVKDGIPIINPTHIVDRKIIPDQRMLISEKTRERLKRYELRQGDVVIARRGNLEKCAVVKANQAGFLCGTGSFFLRLLCVNLDFFVMAYCAKKSQAYLLQDSIGQTMDNLNQKLLSKLPIGLPPLGEQAAIVQRIDKYMTMIDELERQVSNRKERSELLMQSVLRETFEHSHA